MIHVLFMSWQCSVGFVKSRTSKFLDPSSSIILPSEVSRLSSAGAKKKGSTGGLSISFEDALQGPPPSNDTALSTLSDGGYRATPSTLIDDETTLRMIQTIFAEQMGVAAEENSVDLGKLDMDSLMQISILGSLREELEIHLSFNFFLDYPSMSAIKAHFKDKQKLEHGLPLPIPFVTSNPAANHSPLPVHAYLPAVSILLRGSPRAARKTLFFFSDGPGSAKSYALIHGISPHVMAFGLNFPFMTTPHDYTAASRLWPRFTSSRCATANPCGPTTFAAGLPVTSSSTKRRANCRQSANMLSIRFFSTHHTPSSLRRCHPGSATSSLISGYWGVGAKLVRLLGCHRTLRRRSVV